MAKTLTSDPYKPGLLKTRQSVHNLKKILDLPSVCSSRLLPVFCRHDGLHGVDHAVLELEGLDEVAVPDHAAVGHLEVAHALPHVLHLLHALLEIVSSLEDSGVCLFRLRSGH